MIPLNVQFATIISMIAGGFYLGMALETFRRFSHHWRRPAWLLFTMEIGFWLTQTAVLFYILFRANHGELRAYIFIAGLLGFAMYQALAKTLYRNLLELLIRIVQVLYRFIKRLVEILLIAPVKGILSILAAAVLFVIQLVISILHLAAKIIWLPARWILSIVWRLLPNRAKNFLHKFSRLYSTMKDRCSKLVRWIKDKRR